ncbi:hypothetical protein Y1Q_0010328 [Alligator mississippiensis]|uniref:Uncharacterized protein n=1 Tax=Alligator mississippiensis TaxID=8496 RepID=A0A151NM57_ALLMI|nr:hypothetical protein Y1Q_0010328 [Alligator mississippiensis]
MILLCYVPLQLQQQEHPSGRGWGVGEEEPQGRYKCHDPRQSQPTLSKQAEDNQENKDMVVEKEIPEDRMMDVVGKKSTTIGEKGSLLITEEGDVESALLKPK